MREARRATLLVLLALALPALPLVASLPPYPRILAVLNDAAHGPVFGAFAIVVLALLRRFSGPAVHRRYFAALVLALGVGAIIELAQPVIGRAFEWSDLWHDAIGAIAGLLLSARFEMRSGPARRRRLVGLSLTVAAIAMAWPVIEASMAYTCRASRFPTLFQASTPFDRFFMSGHGADVSVQRLPADWRRDGDPVSLRVRFVDDSWPRVALTEPIADWTGYSRLKLDLTNPDATPLTLSVRVHDRAHDNQADDRFSRRFLLEPSRRQVLSIPFEDIARGPQIRELDLSRVAGVVVHGEANPAAIGRKFYITRIWVE